MFKLNKDKYSEDEYNQMRRKVQDLELTKKEERQLIWQALKTLLPGVILAFILVWGIIILITVILL